jgi:hypothetical protein
VNSGHASKQSLFALSEIDVPIEYNEQECKRDRKKPLLASTLEGNDLHLFQVGIFYLQLMIAPLRQDTRINASFSRTIYDDTSDNEESTVALFIGW